MKYLETIEIIFPSLFRTFLSLSFSKVQHAIDFFMQGERTTRFELDIPTAQAFNVISLFFI